MVRSLAFAVMIALAAAPPAMAQSREEQQSARQQLKAGRQLGQNEILDIVLPRFPSPRYEYITSEYDQTARAYRLKFYEDKKRVVWVDVDAESGRILRVSR